MNMTAETRWRRSSKRGWVIRVTVKYKDREQGAVCTNDDGHGTRRASLENVFCGEKSDADATTMMTTIIVVYFTECYTCRSCSSRPSPSTSCAGIWDQLASRCRCLRRVIVLRLATTSASPWLSSDPCECSDAERWLWLRRTRLKRHSVAGEASCGACFPMDLTSPHTTAEPNTLLRSYTSHYPLHHKLSLSALSDDSFFLTTKMNCERNQAICRLSFTRRSKVFCHDTA